MAGSEAKCSARARAAVGPTCRMLSATSTRHNGWLLAFSRFSSSAMPLALSTRSPAPSAFSAFLAARV